jgi:alkylation response protein AidB-like acyl-CoA dehydrogenase
MYTGNPDVPDDVFSDVLKQISAFVRTKVMPRELEIMTTDGIPADLRAQSAEMGLFGYAIPQEWGGLGLDLVQDAEVAMELGYTSLALRSMFGTNNGIAGQVLVGFGTDEQKAQWLPDIASGDVVASFALTEPGAGSDVSAIQTTAELRGGDYLLSGSKMFITNAGEAAWFVVFASTDREAGHRGLSAFVVPAESDGVVVEDHLDKLGQRATDTSALAFHEVRVPAANRLGEEGEGFKIAMRTLDLTRPGTAAGAVGVARAAFEHAIEYSKSRIQFGQPIAVNQGVNFLVADMAAEIEAARLLTWQAAWLIDQGERATLQSSYAKRVAADTAMKVTTDAVQIFGGYGYMKEYPVEKLMRDAKLFQIYEGTSQIQRLVIAREIFLPRNT